MSREASAPSAVFGSNGPLWSLAFEFWYYLWFPALWLLWRRQPSWMLATLAVGWFAPPMALLGQARPAPYVSVVLFMGGETVVGRGHSSGTGKGGRPKPLEPLGMTVLRAV